MFHVATGPAHADSETFTKHVVVAQEGHAADAGRDVLCDGGNAIDAAIATAFALAVTLPEAGNLGGGGFIVAYLADRHEVVTVDFREMAPASSGPADVPWTPTASRGPVIGPGPGRPACRGPSAASGWPMPGSARRPGPSWFARPRGWHARASRSRPTWPARSIANWPRPTRRDGTGRRRDDFGRLGDFPESVAAFGKPDRTPWKAGDRLIQRDLADTLDRIAANGPDEFYTGRTAQLIASYMAEHGGFVTPRRPEVLPGQAPSARPHDVPRLRRLQHRPILIGRDRPLPDAQHPGTLRPEGRWPRVSADAPPRHRGDAAGFFHQGHPVGRPRLRRDPGRRADIEGIRRQAGPIDRREGHAEPETSPRSRSSRPKAITRPIFPALTRPATPWR